MCVYYLLGIYWIFALLFFVPWISLYITSFAGLLNIETQMWIPNKSPFSAIVASPWMMQKLARLLTTDEAVDGDERRLITVEKVVEGYAY